MTVPREIADAYRAGSASWTDGASRNPHADDDTSRGRVLAAAWQRGRQHHRPHRVELDRLDQHDTEQ